MRHYSSVDQFLTYIEKRDPHQPEFLQAVREVVTSIEATEAFIQADVLFAPGKAANVGSRNVWIRDGSKCTKIDMECKASR